MTIHKLTVLSEGGSYGVTLPEEDLREMGPINKDSSLEDECLKTAKKKISGL